MKTHGKISRIRYALVILGGLFLAMSAHAQLPRLNNNISVFRDPNNPYYIDGTTLLFVAAQWTGSTTNLLDPTAWSTGAVPNDQEGARTYGSGYSGTGQWTSGTMTIPGPQSDKFIAGTVLVLPYKTTSGGYAIPDTTDRTNIEWYGGNRYDRVNLYFNYTGTTDWVQNIDHIQYIDGYALNLSGNDLARYTLDINGMGIVRWNTDNRGTTSSDPTYTETSNPRGPTSMMPLLINVGYNATLKFSCPDSVTIRFNQFETNDRRNWGTVNTFINLTHETAVLDMAELRETTASNYAFYKLEGVKGSKVYLAEGDTMLILGGYENDQNQRYDMRLDSDIIGTGTIAQRLQKYGVGTLYLGGENTYTGITWVREGAVFVYGSLAGPVTMADNRYQTFGGDSRGKPDGYWTVSGSLTNTRGYVSAGATGGVTGELRISDNFSMLSSEAWTIVDIKSTDDYDVIKVGGRVTLNGTLQLVPVPGAKLHAGTYRIIETAAPGNVVGDFFAVSKPGLLSMNVDVNIVSSQYVDVVMTQLPFTGIRGLSEVSNIMLPVLDVLKDDMAGNAGREDVIGTLNAASGLRSLDRAIGQLTPLADRYWFTNAVIGTGDLAGRLADRFSQPLKDGGGRFAIFAGYSALDMDMDAADGAETWDGSMTRFLGGVDFYASRSLSVTGFYTRDETKSDLDPLGSRGKIKGNTLGAHAEYRWEKWRFEATVFHGSDDYESRRNISLSGAGDYTNATSSGTRLGGALNFSYAFENVMGGMLSPYAGLQYVKWDADSYEEFGASIPMIVDDQSAASLVGRAGLRFMYPFMIKKKISCRSVVTAGWQTEMGDTSRTIRASLDGNPYSLKLTNDGGGYAVRAAFEFDLLKKLTLHLSAGKENGLHGVDNVSYYAGISCRF